MKGKMFSFRVQSPSVIELLDGLADKSAFIRDAVSEKFLARVAAAATANNTTRDSAAEEVGPSAVRASVGPDNTSTPEGSALGEEATRLRDGMAAIRHAIAALLEAGGETVPVHVRTGLIGISDAAEALVTGQDVLGEAPDAAESDPKPFSPYPDQDAQT